MLINKIVIVFLLLPFLSMGQKKSNIYHLTITKVAKQYRLKNPEFLTAFNKSGYNNQPSYFEDKVVYFATDYYGDDQTEIAKFDFFDKTLSRITYTEEKEYSPILVPGREAFSVVRVETDQKTQALSLYPLDGIGYAKRYMNNTSNIGYHNWIDESTLVLFLVEEPHHNLAIADAKSERRKIILDNIGRCLKVDKDNNIIFVHKISDTEWYLKRYDMQTNKSVIITETLERSEDFELMNDGTILMGSGSGLFCFLKGAKEWSLISDLKNSGISNIKRIASRKNSLVLVDEAR